MAAFSFSCPLRWSDTDDYGHINNVELLRYLEEARVALLFTHAEQAGVSTLEGHIVVARHEVDYVLPLLWRPEPVLVHTVVTRIGGASFTLRYTIAEPDDAATVYVRATTVMVAYDPQARRTRRLTDTERALLERFGEEPGGR